MADYNSADLGLRSVAQGLKPRLIFNGFRGPKGPLFHGSTDKAEFFSKL
jgi:hypothetical protein